MSKLLDDQGENCTSRMRFIIDQSVFAKTLSISAKSLLVKTNLPILSNALIEARRGEIEVISTNLETATRVKAPCKVETEGKITLVGRTLLEFIGQLHPGEVVFEKLGEEAVISTKDNSARLPTIAPEEFPAIPKIEKGFGIKIEAQAFVKNVNRVSFCAAQDEGRPILTGVLCEFREGKDKKNLGVLSMVATDGYRLSYVGIPVAAANGESFKIVIPAKALVEVTKIIDELGLVEKEQDNEITLVVAESLTQVNFQIGEAEFTSRLIEGEFPNWQKIIPTAFTTKIKLSKNELVNLIRIASIFARDAGNIARLKFTGDAKRGMLSVSASASQVGSSDGQMGVTIVGKGGEIAFNFRYLLEALSVIEAEEINFEMIESLNPGKITGDALRDDFFHIIMPVRLQS